MLSQPKGREQKESRKKSKSISHPVGVNIENSQQNAYRRKKKDQSQQLKKQQRKEQMIPTQLPILFHKSRIQR